MRAAEKVQQIRQAVDEHKGKWFHVRFTKRDGTEREMFCRTGVKKKLRGGQLAYNPADYDNLIVYDPDVPANPKAEPGDPDSTPGGYRTVPMSRVQEIAIGGEKFTFND